MCTWKTSETINTKLQTKAQKCCPGDESKNGDKGAMRLAPQVYSGVLLPYFHFFQGTWPAFVNSNEQEPNNIILKVEL